MPYEIQYSVVRPDGSTMLVLTQYERNCIQVPDIALQLASANGAQVRVVRDGEWQFDVDPEAR